MYSETPFARTLLLPRAAVLHLFALALLVLRPIRNEVHGQREKERECVCSSILMRCSVFRSIIAREDDTCTAVKPGLFL